MPLNQAGLLSIRLDQARNHRHPKNLHFLKNYNAHGILPLGVRVRPPGKNARIRSNRQQEVADSRFFGLVPSRWDGIQALLRAITP